MYKKLTLPLFSLLVLFLVVAVVSPVLVVKADTYTIYSNAGGSTTGITIKTQHPSASSLYSAVYITFEADVTAYLTEISVELMQTDSPVGNLTCALYSASGYTIGSLLETSETVLDETTITGSYVWYNFTFGGETLLTFDTDYAIAFFNDGSFGTYDKVYVGQTVNNFAGFGVGAYYSSAWYSGMSGYDNDGSLIVYGADAEPTPTPYFWMEDTIEDFVSFLAPLIILMIPVFLMLLLAKSIRANSVWFVIIGLVIGAALGYVFVGLPAWFIFLIAVAIIGLVYHEVKQ